MRFCEAKSFLEKEIANEIGVHPSTICTEFQRFRETNKTTYHPESLQIEAKKNHIQKPKRNAMTNIIEKYVRQSLKKDCSPEQLVGRMKININQTISHETIYQFIYANKAHGGLLYKHLRHKNKRYHKRTNEYQRRGIIKNRITIDERPTIVDAKMRIGDWEIDTVIGKDYKGALVTLVDRKSKFALIKRVESKHADVVTDATIELLQPLKKFTHTITADNGKEFAYHELIA